MKLILSYPMEKKSPLYQGTPPFEVTPHKSIAGGDSSNTSVISLSTHCGTHIDSPLHFCRNASGVSDIIPYGWSPDPAYWVSIAKEPGECIDKKDIEALPLDVRDAGALLIKTGFCRYRDSEPEIYTGSSPWLHPDAAECILDRLPKLRLFGIDTISVSSPLHRSEGRKCHRTLLCGENPVVILEDSDMRGLGSGYGKIKLSIYPFIYDETDGTPVVVVAEI